MGKATSCLMLGVVMAIFALMIASGAAAATATLSFAGYDLTVTTDQNKALVIVNELNQGITINVSWPGFLDGLLSLTPPSGYDEHNGHSFFPPIIGGIKADQVKISVVGDNNTTGIMNLE